MVLEFKHGQKYPDMKGNFIRAKNMAKEFFSYKTALDTKVINSNKHIQGILRMMILKEMELIFFQIIVNMKVNGKRIRCMEKEL